MSFNPLPLVPLGWNEFFLVRLPRERLDDARVARVVRVERGHYYVDLGEEECIATLSGHLMHEQGRDGVVTVGDWVILAPEAPVIVDRIERRTLIARREAGGAESQPIAANIDVMVVVSGLDAEFNLHRIERYLVMAVQAGVMPVVLLTKADLNDAAGAAVDQVRKRLPPGADVLAVDALHEPLADRLAPWLGAGTTLVVVGSSGVGKSTVVNNLLGIERQATGSTGWHAKGRHTTTSRFLIRLPGGACIIDVPGIREVGLIAEGGVARQFGSIAELAGACRFADCSHQSEPGCAVREAVERGELDPDVWQHYLKLLGEERHNVAEHERRRQERVFGKMVHKTVAMKKRDQGR